MRNILYIGLSDLHLGEEDSLLTQPGDCSRPSPVLLRLAEFLAEVLRHNQAGAPKPGLILAGDALELALRPAPQALAVFEQFLRCVMPSGNELFDQIIYVPGNHDHHLWQTARETQYLNYLGRLGPGDPIEAPWDTTKALMDLAGSDRLVSGAATAIARRLPNLKERNFEILAAYPNFAVRQKGRTVVFHHGHFIEPVYHLFSTIACLFFPEQTPPGDVYTLERENGSWIDFFWSTLGSCGRIGADVESVYEASGDEESLHRLTDTLADSIAREYPVPKWAPRFLREWLLQAGLREVAPSICAGLERRQAVGDAPLSSEASEGLDWYAGLLKRQFEVETGSVPESLSFVLGHTHKPFVECRNGMRILNTGGWVVDAPDTQPLHGASIVLIAEDLSAVAVRCYNEDAFDMRVEEPVVPGEAHSDFFREMSDLIGRLPELREAFEDTARLEVRARAESLSRRLKNKKNETAAACGAIQ